MFSPICRLHGFRIPEDVPALEPGESASYGQDGFGILTAFGGPNEVWFYGAEVEAALTGLLALRERLRPYLAKVFAGHSATGDPMMAPLFHAFPGQPALHAAVILLVAPVLESGSDRRKAVLPEGAASVPPGSGGVRRWRGRGCRVTFGKAACIRQGGPTPCAR